MLAAATSANPHVKFAPWPHYDEDEQRAVVDVLRSGKVNYWTGEIAREFEREYAAHCERRHGVAVANGTLALELALEAFGVGAGDDVVVPSRTYIASASCAVMRGARPIVADVDRDSQLVTAETIAAALTPTTRAVIVVHLAGWPCEMDHIMALAEERGLIVVEDCAQAHGARYRGRPVGSFGHAAAFSFCQDKIITTGGEGGMLVLDDEDAWKRAWAYKDIGRSYDAVYNREHPPGFRWITESFGSNWRMTEMQAAIGRIQLTKLGRWVGRRRSHAQTLGDAFARIPGIRVTRPPVEVFHSYYKYYAFIEPRALRANWSRDRILSEIEAAGVPCFTGSCSEIYREKAFVNRGWKPARLCVVAHELGETSLMFLVHPTLDTQAIEATVAAAVRVMRRAVR